MNTRLPQKVIENFKYYVYLYINPLNGKVFYIGKGKGNRVFSHMNSRGDSRKSKTIKHIKSRGKEPIIEILVYGLQDEQTALKVETASIDLIGKKHLTNLVRGYASKTTGRTALKQLILLYDAKPVKKIDEPAILIKINQLYRFDMSPLELYEATRGIWKLGKRRENAKYAFAIYKGIVREIYEIDHWLPGGTLHYRTRSKQEVSNNKRWEFKGKEASNSIRKKYINKSVKSLFSNPQEQIKYIQC